MDPRGPQPNSISKQKCTQKCQKGGPPVFQRFVFDFLGLNFREVIIWANSFKFSAVRRFGNPRSAFPLVVALFLNLKSKNQFSKVIIIIIMHGGA